MSWYRRAFGPRYLQLYAHRDGAEAERALNASFAPLELRGKRVLDLACGAGRYLAELQRRGAWAVGLDLSPTLLTEARSRLTLPLIRADMREVPLADGSVDVTLSMFTSFGYFEDEADHARLAREMGRVTRGSIVVDVPNPLVLERSLVPSTEREIEGLWVRERRWIETSPPRVCKTIEIFAPGSRENVERYRESVRLFTVDELQALFTPAGFHLARSLGGYDGEVFDPDTSPRSLLRFERQRRSPS